jgi:hypothetical protein
VVLDMREYNMMEYKGYLGIVEYDADAKLFHGDIINTRDVITFQGTTVGEIDKAFRDSIEDYLELCRTTKHTRQEKTKILLQNNKKAMCPSLISFRFSRLIMLFILYLGAAFVKPQ